MIRSYRAEDESAVRQVVTHAFADEGHKVAVLVDDLRAEHARCELVAEEAGEVVGHVMLSRSWVDARRALVEVLVLSPLSVAPARQGRRVGTSLVAAAVGEARRLGVPAVFLEGSPTYYGDRGFEPATPRGFIRASPRVPEPAFQVVVLDGHEEWMTGALVYCEPFWRHDCVGLRDPELGRIEHMFES
ncbi:MAG TPA: N-acetyltransferase [Nocardioides sp.]|uniref:GNAT family N-acetyltransferase n=1 Tax=uncultured Nocardioides sp. TaxID=198441 RepID=UPI0026191446|nr:N-acetyltransferase [uncultured Nocardioides sp.]HRD60953.1 N-acetyltransferase [Nocardioides sp.]HRI97849.1 N-acetyltransferase [Nocardioides sp.]